MNLVGYRSGSYDSAVEAQVQGGIYQISILDHVDDDTLTVDDLNNPDIMLGLKETISNCKGALNIVDGEHDVMFALQDIDGKIVFEMYNGGNWIKTKTLKEINDVENKTSMDILRSGNYNVYAVRGLNGEYTIYSINNLTGDIDMTTAEFDMSSSIEIMGEGFDFNLMDYSNNELCIDVYNLITLNLGDQGLSRNDEFDFTIDLKIVSMIDITRLIVMGKNQLIHKQVEIIEKYEGEAYFGPSDERTQGQGDDIYNALYDIRKIINISE